MQRSFLSPWIDVLGKGSSSNADYSMPDIGDQVAAQIDWRGEAGTVLGSVFNEQHPAPTDNPDLRIEKFGATTVTYDKSTGDMTVEGTANIILKGAMIKLDSDVFITGSVLTHNGVNVGDTHKHGGIISGGAKTDVPS